MAAAVTLIWAFSRWYLLAALICSAGYYNGSFLILQSKGFGLYWWDAFLYDLFSFFSTNVNEKSNKRGNYIDAGVIKGPKKWVILIVVKKRYNSFNWYLYVSKQLFSNVCHNFYEKNSDFLSLVQF